MPQLYPLPSSEFATSASTGQPNGAAERLAPASYPFAMLSHPGSVRHSNEDACGAHPGLGAFIVCDGMGGAAAGEIASQLALETFLETLQRPAASNTANTPAQGPISQSAGKTLFPASSFQARLEDAIDQANDVVFRTAQNSHTLRGMGTTLVAMLLEDTGVPTQQFDTDAPTRFLWLAHVGDSRCYLLRAGVLYLLTQDHSLVEEQIQAGLLSRADAAISPIRNIITRAIGSQPTVEPSIAAHPIYPGDLYLLASDGLNRDLNDAEIAQILIRATASSTAAPILESACQALVDAAIHNGGGDNITVLLLACS